MSSTRRGQSIARRACDACRDRKIKCTWDIGQSCDGCMSANIFCTFQSFRKRRGRPQRNLEKFRTPQAQQSQLLPTSITIEHLCPLNIFHNIIEDYMEDVYPIAPLVHIPTFTSQIEAGLYLTDPAFLRLCFSICALTISSLQRKSSVHYSGHYHSVKDMVARANQLITASRLATSPDWADSPSSNDMLCSLLLGMASHYTQCLTRGWALINESVHACRSLNLYNRDGYSFMGTVESEINKRALWMLYITQIHDRISHTDPFTLLGASPESIDWEFLLPMAVSDDDLRVYPNVDTNDQNSPVTIGFATLVKVFRCVLGLLSAQPSTTMTIRRTPPTPGTHFLSSSSLLRTFNALSLVLDDILADLDISYPHQNRKRGKHTTST